jgi:hypothetical protein
MVLAFPVNFSNLVGIANQTCGPNKKYREYGCSGFNNEDYFDFNDNNNDAGSNVNNDNIHNNVNNNNANKKNANKNKKINNVNNIFVNIFNYFFGLKKNNKKMFEKKKYSKNNLKLRENTLNNKKPNNYKNKNKHENENITTVPDTYFLVDFYSKNNNFFLKNFSNSFAKMVTVGYLFLAFI